jgi:dTDP-4-dehydrorhamnose reductase
MVKVAVIGAGLLGATVADELSAREQGFGYLSHERIEVTDLDSVKRALDGYDVAINTAAICIASPSARPTRLRRHRRQ